jgi:hypothetical protein
MYNWSVDLERLKQYQEQFLIWKLGQLINFGLGGEKLDRPLVIKYWDRLRLDPSRRRFLEFLLWDKRS